MFQREYSDVFAGDKHWNDLPVPQGDTYAWDEDSTYVRLPPYFEGMPEEPEAVEDPGAGPDASTVADEEMTTVDQMLRAAGKRVRSRTVA